MSLQLDVHRSARLRQREAAAHLARSSVETCLLGCYITSTSLVPDALEGDLGRALKRLLGPVVEGAISDDVMELTLAEFPTSRLPDLARVAHELQSRGTLVIASDLYRRFYLPISSLYGHVSAPSLLRQVDRRGEATRERPWHAWGRRSPGHLADACLAHLALTVLKESGDSAAILDDEATALLQAYANDHWRRALPVAATLLWKFMLPQVRPSQLLPAAAALRRFARDLDGAEASAWSHDERRAQVIALVDRMMAVTGAQPPAAAQSAMIDQILAAVAERLTRNEDAADQRQAGC
jgi:hypothetical protein